MSEMPRKSYAAFLFDMDGTLISSTAVTERVYTAWAESRGVDVPSLLKMMHGVRTIDVIPMLGRPDLDPATEAAIISDAEHKQLEGIVALPGVLDFLAVLPPERWAIVTSADRELMGLRLKAAGITPPQVIITAEDVTAGKPDPQGYKLAAARLGFDPADCLVFEDAPAGILAGERAGADVLVITETHSAPIATAHPCVRDYRSLSLSLGETGGLALAFPLAAE
jgi:sugar-phosphatase